MRDEFVQLFTFLLLMAALVALTKYASEASVCLKVKKKIILVMIHQYMEVGVTGLCFLSAQEAVVVAYSTNNVTALVQSTNDRKMVVFS